MAKFQTDRFRTFRENRAEKNNEIMLSETYTLAADTLRCADAGGVNYLVPT